MKNYSSYFSCAQRRLHNQHHLTKETDFGNICLWDLKSDDSRTFNSFEIKQKIDESLAILNTKNEDIPSLNKVFESTLNQLVNLKQQNTPIVEVLNDSKSDNIQNSSEIQDFEWIPQDLSPNNVQSEWAIELCWPIIPEDQHNNQTQIRINADEHDSSSSFQRLWDYKSHRRTKDYDT